MVQQLQKHYKIIKNMACDVMNAFKFNDASQTIVGHILELEFSTSGVALKADISVTDPENPSSKVKVVGVISNIHWEGGATDNLDIEGRLSYEENQGLFQQGLSAKDGGTDIKIKFVIYKYDPKTKKYFKCFHSDNALECVITMGSETDVGQEIAMDIKEPKNVPFHITLSPKSGAEQMLSLAFSTENKITRDFGIVMG